MSLPSQPLSITSPSLPAIHRKSANKHIFRALLSLASAALLIRVMGMVNQMIVSARFGAGATMDAYFVASLPPILIAQLIVSSIENSVLPAYARIRTTRTKEQSSALLSTLLNLLLIGAVLLTGLLLVFRREVIFISAPALDQLRATLATDLTLFLLPALVLMVVLGFLECILNAEGQFGWPAYAGILVPLTTAIFVLVAGKSAGIVTLCIGMVAGLCLQLCMFGVRAKRAGLVYRPVINLRQAEIGLILLAAWPALLGSVISQISPLIDQVFASFLSTGSISALNYALKLFTVPLGVITVSVGRAVVPTLSRQAATNDTNDMKAFKETLGLYLWVVGVGTMVLGALIIVLAHPLVQIFFQHGQFSAGNSNHTATTLMGFALGLAPFSLVLILVRAFSALGKTRVLMYMSLFNVVANAVFDAIFARLWQSEGIALATSLMYFCSIFILLFTLRRMIGKLYLFTPPHKMLRILWKGQHLASLGILYKMRQQCIRAGFIIMVFAGGTAGVFLNALYTLRLALGSVIMLALLRYRYALLIGWALIPTVVGSIPLLLNSNFITALTAPTLVLMALMPIQQTFKRMPALIFLLLFLLWVFASIGISPLGEGAFLTIWIPYLDFLAIALLTANVVTTEQRVMRLIDAMLLAFTFVAFYGIYGYFTRQNGVLDPDVGFRISAIFGSSPTLGLFLSLAIPLALYRTLTLQGFKRVGGLIMILALLVAIGMTLTRGTFISVPVSLLIMVPFLPSRKMKIGLLSGFLALAALVLLLQLVVHISILDRFSGSDITTLNGRTGIWQILLERFDPFLLLGHGLNASGVLLANLGVNDARSLHVTSYESHNLFLGILYDDGIIGVTLLALVFIVLFVSLIRGIRRTDGTHRMLFLTALATLISVCLQSFEVVDIMFLNIGLYFWITMALPFACYWPASKQLAESKEEARSDDEVTILQRRARQRTEREKIATFHTSAQGWRNRN